MGRPSLISPPSTPRPLRASLPGTAPDARTAGRTGRDGPEQSGWKSAAPARSAPRGRVSVRAPFSDVGGGAPAALEPLRAGPAGLSRCSHGPSRGCHGFGRSRCSPRRRDRSRAEAEQPRAARARLFLWAQRGGSFKRGVRRARARLSGSGSGRFVFIPPGGSAGAEKESANAGAGRCCPSGALVYWQSCAGVAQREGKFLKTSGLSCLLCRVFPPF